MAIITVIILIFAILSFLNYLFFHVTVEVFGISVSVVIFSIGLSSRKFTDEDFFLNLAILFLFVAIFDFFHTITYYQMGIFPGLEPNTATQFWVVARSVQVTFFILIVAFPKGNIRPKVLLGILSISSTVLIASIPLGYFPDCYILGMGLTPFKIITEIIITVLFFLTIPLILRLEELFGKDLTRNLVLSAAFAVISEINFMLYFDVYGIANMFGHLAKVLSVYFVYRALVHSSLEQPYSALFSTIKKNETRLEESNTLLKLSGTILRHDLGHELNTVRLAIELVHGEIDNENLEVALTSLDHAIILLEEVRQLEMLAFSEVRPRVRSIREAVSSALQGLAITADVEGDCLATIDITIVSILRNIIRNVGTHSGTSEVSIRIETQDKSCIISISDRGKGIPDDVKPHIFERGYAYGENKGSGLGLFIVRSSIERLGGEISVMDNEPRGSKFVIKLPKENV